ncbi:MAG: hypothetical protein IPL79_06355 [Myxococcales bacterium]|nr:hypothetical protein [Myxococcales bacterium]
MRIACLHLPGFALQAQLRGALDTSLRAEPVAVVGASSRRDTGGANWVIGMSRAAADAGVVMGQSVFVARAACPTLRVLEAEPAAWQESLQAIAEALLGISDCVDIVGRPRAEGHDVFAHVPARMRGDVFGRKVAQVLQALGLRAKIGIADDRFTAWAAAGSAPLGETVSVPRGGAAAFLAPRPLALLGLGPEVLGMLAAGRVTTLGAFAALPPPSTAHAAVAGGWDADLQALARGDGSARLHPFVPHAAIAEAASVELGGAASSDASDVLDYARCVVARMKARLEGRSDLPVAFVVEGVAGNDARRIEIPRAHANDAQGAPDDAVDRAFPSVEQAVAHALRRASRCVVRAEFGGIDATTPAANDAAAPLIEAIGDVNFASAGAQPHAHRRTRRGKHRSRTAQIELFSDIA